MASPSNLDFPLPPRSSVTSLPVQMDNASECANVTGISSSRLLSLVHRYRSQAVTLVARQELLLNEQKVVFELERQLWNTEREIWEEERRLLHAESQGRRGSFVDDAGSIINGNDPRISINARNFESKSNGMNRRRESSGGGSGIAWFLKQGRQPSHNSVTSVEELVSPRDYSTTNLRQNISTEAQARTSLDAVKPPLMRNHSNKSNVVSSLDEDLASDEDMNDLPASLLAEASRIVYGSRAEQRLTPSGNGLRPMPRPTLFTSLSINGSSKNAHSLDSRSTNSAERNKHSNYLASASEDESEPEPNEIVERNIESNFGEQTPKNAGSGSKGKRPGGNGSGNNSGSDKNSKGKDEPDIPLKLKSTQNFGTNFGSMKPMNIRRGSGDESGRRRKKHERGKSGGRQGKTTFYDPETPVDSFGSNVSYIDKGWPPSFNPGSMGKLSAVGSLGAQSTQSNATIKTAPGSTQAPKTQTGDIEPPPTPWGKLSTNKSAASPMLSMSDDSRPNSLVEPDQEMLKIQRDTALLSMKSTLSLNSSVATSPSPPPVSTRESRQAQNMVNNDSPTYTWSPPALITTSPKSPSVASSHSSRRPPLSASDPPSSIISNPRISAVLAQLPLHPFSPPLSATPALGSTTMSLSSVDADETTEGTKQQHKREVDALSTHSEAYDVDDTDAADARRWTDPLELTSMK